MQDPYEVTSVVKAFEILRLFRNHKELGVTEIALMLQSTKGSIYRFLSTLKSLGLLEQDSSNRKYRPAVGLLEFASLYTNQLEWHKLVRPFLEDLSDKTGEDIFLAVLDKTNIIYVDKINGKQMLRMESQIGLQRPAHCTGTGKALLADLDRSALLELYKERELVKYTDKTITCLDELLEHLDEVSKCGYAIDNGEYALGVIGIAATFRGIDGEAIGAISVSGPKFRINGKRVEQIVTWVVDATKEISRRLGYETQ